MGGSGPTEENPYPTGFPYNNYKWPTTLPRKSYSEISRKKEISASGVAFSDADHLYMNTKKEFCPPPVPPKTTFFADSHDSDVEIIDDDDIMVASFTEVTDSTGIVYYIHVN